MDFLLDASFTTIRKNNSDEPMSLNGVDRTAIYTSPFPRQ
jgi:hypothetical protein